MDTDKTTGKGAVGLKSSTRVKQGGKTTQLKTCATLREKGSMTDVGAMGAENYL